MVGLLLRVKLILPVSSKQIPLIPSDLLIRENFLKADFFIYFINSNSAKAETISGHS